VTDAKTLELVKQAAGMLQLEITARLSMSLNNTPLQGAHINVVSGNFIIAQPLAWTTAWIIATAGAFVALMKKPFTASWIAAPSC
jgi:acetylglutamate kinase